MSNTGDKPQSTTDVRSLAEPQLSPTVDQATQINSDKRSSFSRGPAPNLNWPPSSFPIGVNDLDWETLERLVSTHDVRARMPQIASGVQQLLESGPRMLFDCFRSGPDDRAIQISSLDTSSPLWFIGDLHGDLLALEAALHLIRDHPKYGSTGARIVFLGDLFDDEGFGLETVLRVFELATQAPDRIAIVAGNHDEALAYNGTRFTSLVEPSDFSILLNENLSEEAVVRTGKLAVRLFANAPRALFLPDGLLVAHGGFPLADLHSSLWETGNWNDPRCLSDFVWTRLHPTARKKLPNRHTKGSQFGYEDFATFCSLATSLGRNVTHMVRGHDHVEARFAIYPAYTPHPILTINALSRRLPRELDGPFERWPTVALYETDRLPQVYQIQMPQSLVQSVYGCKGAHKRWSNNEGLRA